MRKIISWWSEILLDKHLPPHFCDISIPHGLLRDWKRTKLAKWIWEAVIASSLRKFARMRGYDKDGITNDTVVPVGMARGLQIGFQDLNLQRAMRKCIASRF